MIFTKFLILYFMFFLFLAGCDKPRKPLDHKKASILIPAEIPEKEFIPSESLLNELKQKNPFQAQHSAEIKETKSLLHLKGIVWDSARPFAVIGDNVVIEGDYTDGKKVIKINKDSIELDNGGVKEVLRLGR